MWLELGRDAPAGEELCDLLPENHKIGGQTDKTLILKALRSL